MVIRTSQASNASALSDMLSSLDVVREFRVSPLGD